MTIKIGWLGTSITAGTYLSAGQQIPLQVASLLTSSLGQTVTCFNYGSNGSTSGDWKTAASGGTGNLDSAVTDMLSNSVPLCHYEAGANDAHASVSAATYQANVSNTIAYLVSNGITPYVSYPGWITDTWDTGSPTKFLVQYQASIDAAVNDTTSFRGDTTQYAHLLANQSELQDGVHPGWAQGGIASYSAAWAAIFQRVFGARIQRSPFKGGKFSRR